ncbi:hypothetical protein EXIGLDRAFT_840411 [Exidia glandulosa HHB12029]|uniref:Uncharacterized protein n=1 Tax=Exidia glandulosa HHB12029 TaxID=1314781 RepID=A0A165ZYI5_EXIGL|nr:hypothetical protein EXIGLDRAFT_840411 [Exidia glandulosa HHB12029]
MPQITETVSASSRPLPRRRTTLPNLIGDRAELEPLHVTVPVAPSPSLMAISGKYGEVDDIEGLSSDAKSKILACTGIRAYHLLIIAFLALLLDVLAWQIYAWAKSHPTERIFPSEAAQNAFVYLPTSLALLYVGSVCGFMFWTSNYWLPVFASDCGAAFAALFFLGLLLVVLPISLPDTIIDMRLSYAWKHRCDADAMQVILVARSFDSEPTTRSQAHFYQRGASYPMFTYVLGASTVEDPERVTFDLSSFDVSREEIPAGLSPLLRGIRYVTANHTLSGDCFASVDAPGAPISCLTGSYIPGVSFSLRHEAEGKETQELRVFTRGWRFKDESPALTLKITTSEPPGRAEVVFKTVFPRPSDCTQLKVCIPRAKVDAALLVPLGIVLHEQANYALKCTAPAPK